MLRLIVIAVAALMLSGCTQKPDPTVKIAINPWPGYEYLLLAEQLGYYKQMGLDLTFVPFSSLSDAQRAYISGRVDGFTGTLIEAVQAQVLSHRPLQIVLIADYSNGGDVIIAKSNIDHIEQLRGARVGAEVSSLGIYFLHQALATAGLTLDDVILKNYEQSAAQKAFAHNQIDAFVTYPPHSLELLHDENKVAIFNSGQLPMDIVDTLVIASDVIESNPDLVSKLHQVWQQTLSYSLDNPDRTHAIMAKRQGITTEAFKQTLDGTLVLDYNQQKQLFNEPEQLQNKLKNVCQVLANINAIDFRCSQLPPMLYRGNL